jgi:hypothetical protein
MKGAYGKKTENVADGKTGSRGVSPLQGSLGCCWGFTQGCALGCIILPRCGKG